MDSLLESFDLTGKVAIVTGGTRGIGLAIARGLGTQGASVVVSSRREELVESAVKGLEAEGIEVRGIRAHMGEPEQIEELVADTVNAFGGVDIAVNNAAANPVYGPLLETDDGAFDKIVEVNLKGPLNLARRVHPIMVGRGGGSIINISSVAGVSPEKGLGIYSMSKAALISLTKVMAREWGRDGIRVNAICPGLIQTRFSTALWQDEKTLSGFEARTPLGRIGQPAELLALAVYLASPASSYCTGSVFTVDGGATI
jgi:NAD(P)-dependent dehydrogenase (short-subunit alcohol dehydrogenase family)